MLADANPWRAGLDRGERSPHGVGRVGFRVPRVELAWPPPLKNEDAGASSPEPTSAGLRPRRLGGSRRGRGASRQQGLGKAQPSEREKPRPERLPTRDADTLKFVATASCFAHGVVPRTDRDLRRTRRASAFNFRLTNLLGEVDAESRLS